jgi:hypothetical protein
MKLGTKVGIFLILVVLIGGTVYAMNNKGDSVFSDTGTSTVADASKGGFWASLTNWFSGDKNEEEHANAEQGGSTR